MKLLLVACMVLTLAVLMACQDQTTGLASPKLVEGSWQGTLDSQPFDVTFIEGEFEGSPTVAGSAHVTEQAESVFYSVGSATHNRRDTVWFCLYKVPNVTGEGYVIKGGVSGGNITGTFRQANQDRVTTRTGTWEVHRVP